MVFERGKNTHSKGKRVKIPFLPSNVGKGEYKQPQDHQTGHDITITTFKSHTTNIASFVGLKTPCHHFGHRLTNPDNCDCTQYTTYSISC